MTYGASSPHRSQSETRIKVMFEAELTVFTEDYASASANNGYIELQLEEQAKEIRKHTDLKNVRMEGPF